MKTQRLVNIEICCGVKTKFSTGRKNRSLPDDRMKAVGVVEPKAPDDGPTPVMTDHSDLGDIEGIEDTSELITDTLETVRLEFLWRILFFFGVRVKRGRASERESIVSAITLVQNRCSCNNLLLRY